MPGNRLYKSGDRVPVGGIYEVSHTEHRVPHEVTLLKGQKFPPCACCGNHVRFKVIRKVNALNERRERIILNVLPVMEDAVDEDIA